MTKHTLLLFLAGAGALPAHYIFNLPEYEVQSRGTPLLGETMTASEGIVGRLDFENRPMLRIGEIIETVPGMIATQHSGSGKANQYFLRGFNLDHATDFAAFIDAVPVNIRTHGHGHGYLDLSFVIPEMVRTITYRKGPYYADVGDFSSAGSAYLQTVDALEKGILKFEAGQAGHLRGLLAASSSSMGGTLLTAIEGQSYDGPWTVSEDFAKINGLLKFTRTYDHLKWFVSLSAYDASWNAADQIPLRAVSSGLISPWGSLDPSAGGRTTRYALTGNAQGILGAGDWSVTAYATCYDMNLWSNFTYFLEDPVDGDQFEQADRRRTTGLRGDYHLTRQHGKTYVHHHAGVLLQHDHIPALGLYNSAARQRLGAVRADKVNEFSTGGFYEATVYWTDKLRTITGLRADYYHFDVTSDLPVNSGTTDKALLSPKAGLSYQLRRYLELYTSAGWGLHSNDARGTVIAVDPGSGVPVDPVDPLVRSRGAEIGMRLSRNERWHMSLAVFRLTLESELLFVGDAGTTEPSRPSRRHGIELSQWFRLSDRLTLEADIAWTDADFRDTDPAGQHIPGAIRRVVSSSLTYKDPSGFYSAARLRHFGDYPLIEDGSLKSGSSTTVNWRIGYDKDAWGVFFDVLNVFNSRDRDIAYLYASRLPGEPPEGVEDIHFHPLEARAFRAGVVYRF